MTATAREMLEKLTQLSADDRADLVDELVATLPATAWSDAWRAEADRRWKLHLQNPGEAIPASQVHEELRRRSRG